MGQQQQQSSQGGGDNALAPLWITVLLFITIYLIWHFAHVHIVNAYFSVKLFQAQVISLFTNHLADAINTMKAANIADVTFKEAMALGTQVGDYMRIPLILFLLAAAAVLYFSDAIQSYRSTYSMKHLANEEVSNWPQITPVLKFNLIKEDIEKGPWAMALTPLNFAKKHGLTKLEYVVKTEGLRSKEEPVLHVIPEEARRVFSMQLGRPWEGVDNLPVHVKALFAAFVARINRERDLSAQLLLQYTRSTGEGKLDFSGVDKVVQQYANTYKVQQVITGHAYVLTVMAALLAQARHDGVLASADFLWLKPVDRPLWYMLNTVGRQTPFPEAAGPFAHWLAEKELGRKIMVPMVDEALKGFELAIKEIKYVPDEDDEAKQEEVAT